MRKIACFLVFVILCVGCAGNTGIVKISDDTYMLGRQSVSANSGSVIKAALYKEGNEYCASLGKKLIPVSDSHKDFQQFQTFAGAEIKFKCE